MRICTLYALWAFQSTLPTRGSDGKAYKSHYATIISIHAPHEGERLLGDCNAIPHGEFQSTLPTRGSDAFATAHTEV